MGFDHVGIMNEDEGAAVRFYQDLLGLEKIGNLLFRLSSPKNSFQSTRR